ncbi:unnamed protein product [Didymodactylos carnosus]|uniref:Uncharacterized protein n=1 Tax=Didymodactylos carnosus TaxID=1234261 RepID=A0A814LLC0_9BILA|nr:unnamed protein product [Didymodactylos carnosus]CAF1065236.1 unnamed protein product [Didymodactylos carnosus]CAF3816447.1 unnamed protein product [Didymodactylos carnosus]CAF3833008.1 unnamed protein product [Didymodactylos carnosus]
MTSDGEQQSHYTSEIDALDEVLIAYGLTKLYCSSVKHEMPLLTGFFATHLQAKQRPPHIISFCSPINEDPSSKRVPEYVYRCQNVPFLIQSVNQRLAESTARLPRGERGAQFFYVDALLIDY